MSITTLKPSFRSPRRYRKSKGWFERFMAMLVLLNFALVIFDLTYIPLRDFWLQGKVKVGHVQINNRINFEGFEFYLPHPHLTSWYDQLKGIEPNNYTENYLRKVDSLRANIQQEPQSPAVAAMLTELRNLSVTMIENNPFEIANKTGTLETIKSKMRQQIFGSKDRSLSAKQAFREFWSAAYLASDTDAKLYFFQDKIRPLLETNYFRHIGENNRPVNNFGFIDFPFAVIFLAEFLGRTLYISRRFQGVSWLDAMLWRWYDWFLLIPIWRWLRGITVIVRLQQTRLISLSAIQKQISQGFVAGIAEDMTEVVVVRVINQMQDSIRRGEINDFLSQRAIKPYIDLNDTNETAELAKLVTQLTVYQVMPTIKPDIEALLQHNLEKVLKQVPAYQGLQFLPGMEQLQTNLAKQVVKEVYQVLYSSLHSAIEEDPVNEKLIEQLINNLTKALGSQIQAQETLERVQYLLDALLEEVKINYVERLSSEDIEAILAETREIRNKVF